MPAFTSKVILEAFLQCLAYEAPASKFVKGFKRLFYLIQERLPHCQRQEEDVGYNLWEGYCGGAQHRRRYCNTHFQIKSEKELCRI